MKLWPARSKHLAEGPITDLDAIVAKPIPFRFKGKVHVLKPFSLEEFLVFANAQAALSDELKSKEPVGGAEEIAKKYHAVIASVCDTITVKDIMDMEQVQVAALYQLVIDMVTGQIDLGEGKKKRLKLPIYDSAGL